MEYVIIAIIVLVVAMRIMPTRGVKQISTEDLKRELDGQK